MKAALLPHRSCLWLVAFFGAAACAPVAAPVARRVPHRLTAHGHHRDDPYYWLRQRESPEVRAHLRAENAYTEAQMAPHRALEERLYRELVARAPAVDTTAPEPEGGYVYYRRTPAGKEYAEHLRRRPAPEGAPEELLLDENLLARGQGYCRVGIRRPSPDGRLYAYGVDHEGSESYTLRFRDLGSARDLPDTLTGLSAGVAWAADGKSLFYVTLDAARRPFQVWRHVLGTSPATDTLVHHEVDEKFYASVQRSRSGRFVYVVLESLTTTEVRYLEAAAPEGALRVFEPRRAGHEYRVEHRGERFYVVSNDGARNFRLFEAPVQETGRAAWKELLPERADRKLEQVEPFAGHLVLYGMKEGLRRAEILDLATGTWRELAFPEAAYALSPAEHQDFGGGRWRYHYSSPASPPRDVDYDLGADRHLTVKQQALRGYDPTRYEVSRLWVPSHDGVRVPVTLVRPRGRARDGQGALYLYGYGAYGMSAPAAFSAERVNLYERGVSFAIAHVRGGGELGAAWYEAGKYLHKKNTFLDFIAVAEFLCKEGYTRPERLVASGRSAGGLLMGAVLNLRPDLFRAVVAGVPFVDVVTTMLDASLPLTVGEYEEWGNPEQKAYYDYLLSYSPYDQVARRAYPALLVTSGFHDTAVSYWEPAKWVARLRARKTDHNPLLLRMPMSHGHGGPSGRFTRLRESAFEQAFLLGLVGWLR